MTEPQSHQSPQLRIGDAERENALQALGEHMSVGRLDINEYGERAAQVTAAKTRGELDQVFVDLPEPHPRAGAPLAAPAPLPAPRIQPAAGSSSPVRWEDRPPLQRAVGALVPLSGILAVVLFFTVPGMSWVIFLLPCAVTMVAGALWGDDWNRGRKGKS